MRYNHVVAWRHRGHLIILLGVFSWSNDSLAAYFQVVGRLRALVILILRLSLLKHIHLPVLKPHRVNTSLGAGLRQWLVLFLTVRVVIGSLLTLHRLLSFVGCFDTFF